MSEWYYEFEIVCHWCGKRYRAKKGRLHARFCSARCKQAHYRAYKKWVTDKSHVAAGARNQRVTPKKPKKRK